MKGRKKSTEAAQLCFVDMPFGKKIDPASRVEIDFDDIYRKAIEPAVQTAGLTCVRGDQERTGGIIHKPMFGRLLLCEFVIADMTTASPNVFYELGIRHAAKPHTTIPIFATIGAPPFDVGCVRAIPYDLENGKLTIAAGTVLKKKIMERIDAALTGPVSEDSPLFQLFKHYPGIDISHELADVFRERVEYSAKFRDLFSAARSLKPRTKALARLKQIQKQLGRLQSIERGVLVDLFLSYRDIGAHGEMINLYDKLPSDLRATAICQQQLAFALNREARKGNSVALRGRAIRVLDDLLKEQGGSAETYGIIGSIHKDAYREARAANRPEATAHLDDAITAYRKGFDIEPADYYPGVNVINLLLQRADKKSLDEVDYLMPLVSYAVARRGGMNSTNYWDLATVLELALIGRDASVAERALTRVLVAADALNASWAPGTTADNLEMVESLRRNKEDTGPLHRAIAALRQKEKELGG